MHLGIKVAEFLECTIWHLTDKMKKGTYMYVTNTIYITIKIS